MDSKKQNIYKRIESGLRFKQVRVALGKTQEEFAEILGLSVNSIKKIEKGENNVSVSNLRNCVNRAMYRLIIFCMVKVNH